MWADGAWPAPGVLLDSPHKVQGIHGDTSTTLVGAVETPLKGHLGLLQGQWWWPGAWTGLFSLDLYQPSGVNSGFPSYILQISYDTLDSVQPMCNEGYTWTFVSFLWSNQWISFVDLLCIRPCVKLAECAWGHCLHCITMLWMQGIYHLYSQKERNSVLQGLNYRGKTTVRWAE